MVIALARGGFWSEQCPQRGPALTHAHGQSCLADHGGRHAPTTCCHCGEDELDGPAKAPESWPPSAALPEVDIEARLRQIGLVVVEHEPDTMVEPRMITGNGPQGATWGKGRGKELTPADIRRLNFYTRYLRPDNDYA